MKISTTAIDNLKNLYVNRKGEEWKQVPHFYIGNVAVSTCSTVASIPVACVDPGSGEIDWWCKSGGTLVSMLKSKGKKPTKKEIYQAFCDAEFDDEIALCLWYFYGKAAVTKAGRHPWRKKSRYEYFKGLKLSKGSDAPAMEDFFFFASACLKPNLRSRNQKLNEFVTFLEEMYGA